MKNILFLFLISVIAFSGCGQPKPVKTIENLKAGIKEETTASEKYAAFAQRALEEGHDTISKLFEATSKAKSIHVANHLKVLEKLGAKMDEFVPEYTVATTAENLEAAIDDEHYEVTTVYVKFIEDAKAEKVPDALKSFTWASESEDNYEQLYSDAMDALDQNAENTLPFEYAVCPECGNIYVKAGMVENCAICRTPSEEFIII